MAVSSDKVRRSDSGSICMDFTYKDDNMKKSMNCYCEIRFSIDCVTRKEFIE